jgi:hypothetical protein
MRRNKSARGKQLFDRPWRGRAVWRPDSIYCCFAPLERGYVAAHAGGPPEPRNADLSAGCADVCVQDLPEVRLSLGSRGFPQLVEKRLRVLQIPGIEALAEPGIDRVQDGNGLAQFALIRQMLGEAGRGA